MFGRTTGVRELKLMARLIAVLVAVLIVGCGGSVGVDDGSIVGTVFGDGPGGSATPTPLSGVTVVAQRTGATPGVIRTSTSDANGQFVFSRMPTGEYTIGFAKRGFQTIDTAQGATNSRTALGDQVRVFVEPSATSVAPDITMAKLPDEGDCTIVITLIDAVSGTPVSAATVTVGAATTSNGGANGVYTLSVPVRVSSGGDGSPGLPPSPVNINVTAEGFESTSITPTTVTPIANETVSITVNISPLPARITGFVRISQFETLYNKDQITITADGVPQSFLLAGKASAINANGFFEVLVPCSTSTRTRQFNLTFTAPNLQPTVVSNVVAPGPFVTRQLTSPVVMQPVTVDLVGTVVDSSGSAPNQLNPQGIPDTVTVIQTGQVGNIVNGAYTIPDVPSVAAAINPANLTIRATAFNPLAANGSGGFGVQEVSGDVTVEPRSDGTPNPTFTVPLISTSAGS